MSELTMTNPQQNEGYKPTEIGFIPEDWIDYKVENLLEFQGGSQPDKSNFINSSRSGYIRLIQIRDYKTNKYETYVPTHMARRFCTEDDIMIGRYGPPIFQILRGIPGAYNVALIKAIPNERVSKTYAYYFLTQEKLFGFIEKLSQRSSGQTGVDLQGLRQYPFSLPPTREEQDAIAHALSDIDALIESLDRLLTKKRQIKQGAMQELLRSKEGWEKKYIGDVLTISHGRSQHEVIDENGAYPILASGGEIGRAKKYLYNKSSVLIGRKGTIDKPQYMDQPFWTVDTLFYSVIHEPNDAKYIFYQFCLIPWREYNEASGVPSLNARTIHSIEITLPPPEEQIEIATILSDMDAEIDSIEAKLTKTRQIKQGMMHELLTGRIRLI
jgi:type I restriction enzyme, S subunit